MGAISSVAGLLFFMKAKIVIYDSGCMFKSVSKLQNEFGTNQMPLRWHYTMNKNVNMCLNLFTVYTYRINV